MFVINIINIYNKFEIIIFLLTLKHILTFKTYINNNIRMDYRKLDELINYAINYENDDYLVNINLKKHITDKLYTYQFRHLFNLIFSMRNNNVIIDGSDAGTGKTYTSIALCKQLNLKPFIICPKSIISNWANVCKYFYVKPLEIINYEMIRNGNSSFVTVNKSFKNEKMFQWKLPRNTIVIFDEVHKCKNRNTLNGKLLLSTRNLYKVLLISATISDTPKSFHIFGYMLKFYNNMRKANGWINSMLREDKCSIGNKDKQSSICKKIYPSKGSRVRISELGSSFPQNQVSADCYYIDKNIVMNVNKAFEEIDKNTIQFKSSGNNFILNEIMIARQKIEYAKIDIFVDLCNDYLDNYYNVAIFVNFVDTLKELSKRLKTKSLIYGDLDIDKREKNIKNFQENKTNVIICTIKAGNLGISLHDLYGVPRVSLISPTFSSIDLIQTLGRINRQGSKTPALQRIIFCANTCEEIICNKVKKKLDFISKLNDNDLIDIK